MKVLRKLLICPPIKAICPCESRLNNAALAFFVTMSALIAGCAPGRRGPFIELGAGINAVSADEKWTVRKYGSDDGTDGGLQRHDAIARKALPTANFKIGYGFTEQFLVYPTSVQIGQLARFSGGVMFFTKKTVPTLIFDINYGGSLYNLISLPNRFPDNVTVVDKGAAGDSWNVGVGYEFRRNWIIKGDFSFGTHSFYDSTYDLGDLVVTLVTLGLADTGPHYKIEGEATVYSLGFRIGYIWY